MIDNNRDKENKCCFCNLKCYYSSNQDCCYNIKSHLCSPYCLTRINEKDSWIATLLCFPVKLVIFLPCHFRYINCLNLNIYCK